MSGALRRGRSPLPHSAELQRTSPERTSSLNVPCSSVRGLQNGELSSLPGRCRQPPGGGEESAFWRTERSLLVGPCAFQHGRPCYDMTSCCDLQLRHRDAEKSRRVSAVHTSGGGAGASASPLSISAEALSERDEAFSVCLTFHLSKGGGHSCMRGSCRRGRLLLTPTANRITAHKRVHEHSAVKMMCDEACYCSGLERHNRPAKTSAFGKYCEAESGLHISSPLSVLRHTGSSSSEVSSESTEEISAVSFAAR